MGQCCGSRSEITNSSPRTSLSLIVIEDLSETNSELTLKQQVEKLQNDLQEANERERKIREEAAERERKVKEEAEMERQKAQKAQQEMEAERSSKERAIREREKAQVALENERLRVEKERKIWLSKLKELEGTQEPQDIQMEDEMNISPPTDDEVRDVLRLIEFIKTNDETSIERTLQEFPNCINYRTIEYYTPLYIASKQGSPAIVNILLQHSPPPLIKMRENTGSTALHVASKHGHLEVMVLLLDAHMSSTRDFDPNTLQNHFGESPLDICRSQFKSNPENPQRKKCMELLQKYSQVRSSNNERIISSQVQTYNTGFVRAVSISPLIGDRNQNFNWKELDADLLIAGLYKEERHFLRGSSLDALWVSLREEWVGSELPSQQSCFWKCHLTAKRMEQRLRLALSQGERALYHTAIFLYTVESFLFKSVNAALRCHDESKRHLAPYVSLLHHSLRFFTNNRFAYPGPCYRGMSLPSDVQKLYKPQLDKRRNYCSFDGFTSASCDASQALNLLSQWNLNTLLILSPSDPSNPHCLPVRIAPLSAYPQEEEVLYTIGQQFEMKSWTELSIKQLAEKLGVIQSSMTNNDEITIVVVELMAVDVFWEFASDLYQSGQSLEEVEAIMKNKVEMDKTCKGLEHPSVALGLSHLARIAQECGRLEEAIPLLLEAIRIDKIHLGENHTDIAVHMSNLASVYIRLDRLEEAEKLLLSSVRIANLDTNEHPALANWCNNLASLYMKLQKFHDALPLFEKCVHLSKSQLGDTHPDTVIAMGNLGSCYERIGNLELAEDIHQKSLTIGRSHLKDHPALSVMMTNLAFVYERREKFMEALELYHEAIMNGKRVHHSDLPKWVDHLKGLLLKTNLPLDYYTDY